jgi:glycogen operon protein
MTEQDWKMPFARSIGILLEGAARPDMAADGRTLDEDCLFIAFNAFQEPLGFKLPVQPGITHWARVLDTADPEGALIPSAAASEVRVAGAALAVFVPARESDA